MRAFILYIHRKAQNTIERKIARESVDEEEGRKVIRLIPRSFSYDIGEPDASNLASFPQLKSSKAIIFARRFSILIDDGHSQKKKNTNAIKMREKKKERMN